MKRALEVTTVYYPESDGKPMGETDRHRKAIIRLIDLLADFYEGQKAYVSGDLLVYYVPGNPKKFVVPDVFVAKGVPPGDRRTYRVWLEGKMPDVIIEVTSRKTRRKDHVDKPELYARLGVLEYFLFDPEFDYLEPPLQGYRLVEGEYQRIEPDLHGGFISEQLNLRLSLIDHELHFYRLDNGERLLTARDREHLAEQQALQAEQQAFQAEQQAMQAEQQALQAKQQAQQAALHAQQAEQRAAELQAELDRLRTLRPE